jgi:hypothetical protein
MFLVTTVGSMLLYREVLNLLPWLFGAQAALESYPRAAADVIGLPGPPVGSKVPSQLYLLIRYVLFACCLPCFGVQQWTEQTGLVSLGERAKGKWCGEQVVSSGGSTWRLVWLMLCVGCKECLVGVVRAWLLWVRGRWEVPSRRVVWSDLADCSVAVLRVGWRQQGCRQWDERLLQGSSGGEVEVVNRKVQDVL